jgi:fibronectin-binding autotransporter adhesin
VRATLGLLLFSFGLHRAYAQTWSGGSLLNSKWSTGGVLGNWSGAAAPASDGTATVAFGGNNRTSPDMDADWNINSLTFNNGAASFTLGSNGSHTLTIQGGGITNNSTSTETISNAVTLGAAQTWSAASGNLTVSGNIANGGNLLTISGGSNTTLSGIISGSGGLTKSGNGTLTLSAANTYSGATTASAGTLKLDNNGTTTARLTNTSGITVNSGGTLLLASSSGSSTDRISNSATVTMNGGGMFKTGGLSEGTRPTNGSASDGAAGMGALTLQNTTSLLHVTIDFGSTTAGSSLVFSSLAAASKGAFVDILNWGGTAWTDNGANTNDRLLFATDPGFSASDLANFAFSGYATGAVEITYGNLFEICPVPEPSTWFAGFLALAALGYQKRRRLSAVLRRTRD